MAGQVFAVGSGKGGVGKTTTVVNTGVALRRDNKSVALIDGDLAMPNLATPLGITYDVSIHDVLAGNATPEDAHIEGGDEFGIFLGDRSLEKFGAIDSHRFSDIIDYARERYDYVLVDTGGGLGFDEVLVVELVDSLVLVTTPDPAATGDTRRTAKVANKVGCDIRGIVINRVTENTNPSAIAAEFDCELLGTIPDDPTAIRSYEVGKPIHGIDPASPAATAFEMIAANLTGNTTHAVSGLDTKSDDASTDASTPQSTASDPSLDTTETNESGPQPPTDGSQSPSSETQQLSSNTTPQSSTRERTPTTSTDANSQSDSEDTDTLSKNDTEPLAEFTEMTNADTDGGREAPTPESQKENPADTSTRDASHNQGVSPTDGDRGPPPGPKPDHSQSTSTETDDGFWTWLIQLFKRRR